MSTPFRQQIDKEGGVLGEIESRDGLAAHDLERIALVAAHSVDAVDARAGAYGRI
jgi:hypothetical protein